MVDRYVAAPLLGALISAAGPLGFERAALLSAIGLDDVMLDDPDLRVPSPTRRRLWQALVRERDTSVGIRAAQRFPKGALSTIEYLIRTSATLGEAIRLIPGYTRVVTGQSPPILEESSEGLTLINQLDYDVEARADIAAVEFVHMVFMVLIRRATGTSDIPATITFKHARSSADDAYDALAPTVHFERPQTTLSLDSATLELPMVEQDPALHALVRRSANRQLADHPVASTIMEQVCQTIVALLPGDEPSLDAVATRLGTSGRALQRALKAEGTTFRALAEQTRSQLAKRYLAELNLTIFDVALLLNYADGASFNRAFNRWTGMSPRAYRKSLGAPPQP